MQPFHREALQELFTRRLVSLESFWDCVYYPESVVHAVQTQSKVALSHVLAAGQLPMVRRLGWPWQWQWLSSAFGQNSLGALGRFPARTLVYVWRL